MDHDADVLDHVRVGERRTSPTSMVLEMAASTRRMILPERVLGMSGTIWTFFGRAILPMEWSIAALARALA